MFTGIILINLFRSVYINITGLDMNNIGGVIFMLISTYPIIYLGICVFINLFKIYYMGDQKISFFDNLSLRGLTLGGLIGYVIIFLVNIYIIRPYVNIYIIRPYVISSIQFGIQNLEYGLDQISVEFAAFTGCFRNVVCMLSPKYYGVKHNITIYGRINAYVFTKGIDANQKALRGSNIKLLAGRATFYIKQASS